jgi:tRNA A58 N-methylase Trm61
MTYSTFIHSGIVNPAKPDIKVTESENSVDTVTLDIPLLTRVLEFVREDLKSDVDLHFMLTNMINIKNKGVLTMQDYEAITAPPKTDGDSVELESIKKLAGL